MEEIKARLKLTEIIMDAIRQGLTVDDIKRIFESRIKAHEPKQG